SDAANKTDRGRTHTEFVMKRDLTLSASTISKFLSDERGRLLIELEFIFLSPRSRVRLREQVARCNGRGVNYSSILFQQATHCIDGTYAVLPAGASDEGSGGTNQYPPDCLLSDGH